MHDPVLAAGCAALGIDTVHLAPLARYLDLLERWNKRYNLTAVREREAIVSRHVLDGLSVLPFLRGRRFLDAGTGAGLPGIPLAICLPHCDFCLLDSNGKKTRFLFQVKTALALTNIRIATARAETHRPEVPYDGVLSRAFASLPAIVRSCGQLTAAGGALYAMKAAVPDDELDAVRARGFTAEVTALEVPGLDARRSLITLRAETRA